MSMKINATRDLQKIGKQTNKNVVLSGIYSYYMLLIISDNMIKLLIRNTTHKHNYGNRQMVCKSITTLHNDTSVCIKVYVHKC